MPTYSDETRQKLGDLLLKLRSNPKTAKTVAKAIQELDPAIRFPDVEHDELREYVDKRLQEAEEQREREELERRLAMQRRKVMEGFGPDPETQKKHIERVEQLMKKYNLFDYEAAAKLYAAENPPPPPKPERPSANWEAPKTKELFENLLGYEREQAYRVIDELAAARKARSH
jgi:hypothetical protein